MAGLTWFELDVDMPDDPKCMALGARLKNPLAFAYVVRIYAYCYRHASDRFEGVGAETTVETAAAWRGKTGSLVAALVAEKFLERDGEALIVHGVAARLGPHLAARQHAASRQRRRRDKAATDLARHADVTRDVTRDTRVSHTDNRDRDLTTVRTGARTGIGGYPPKRSKTDEVRERFPLAGELFDALAEQWPNLGFSWRDEHLGALEADAKRRGGASFLADACIEYAEAARITPESIALFAAVLPKLPAPRPRRKPGENPGPDDADFNDETAWNDPVAFMKRDGHPLPVEGPSVRVVR